MASNISTPQKITASDGGSFAERVGSSNPSNTQANNSSAASGNDEKSGRGLPELGGKDEEVKKGGFGFAEISAKIAAMASSLGLVGDKRAEQDLATTEVGRVMAGGTSNAATMNATAQKVGLEPDQPKIPQKSVSELPEGLLAQIRGEKSVITAAGANMAASHDMQYAGAPQKTPEAAAIAT